MDDGDTRITRVAWRRQLHGRTVDRNAAVGGCLYPGEDLDECRLARAVLPDQSDDLASGDAEVDTAESKRTAEAFRQCDCSELRPRWHLRPPLGVVPRRHQRRAESSSPGRPRSATRCTQRSPGLPEPV